MSRPATLPADPATLARLEEAYTCWRRRQDRHQHPAGKFDNAKRWWPSAEERCDCCNAIREPSRTWPNSLNKHCRSVEHIAALHDVEPSQLRATIRQHEPIVRRKAGDHPTPPETFGSW